MGDTVSDFRHGRVPRAVREQQLLELAEELFAERGYEGASMDELARRAGVSKPVIYDIVGSKEALFGRCFERAGEELAAVMVEAAAAHRGDIEGLLRASALAFLDFIASHERAWAVLYELDAGGRTAEHVRIIRARQAALAAGQMTEQAPGLSPQRAQAVAYMVNGAFEFAAQWWREDPALDQATVAEWLVEFTLPGLERLLAGPPDGS